MRAEQGHGLTYMRITPDRGALAQHGLTIKDVNTLTEALAVGHRAGVVREGDRRFEIAVKLDRVDGDLDRVRKLPLRSARGAVVPLSDVATVEAVTGPLVVNRNKLSRRITVEANVRGRDLVSVVDDARAAVQRDVAVPAGYRIEWGGTFENFLSAISAGQPWFDALMRAIAVWDAPQETVDGRSFRYLIGGEAFDWLLLAERLLESANIAAPNAVPASESERLLFEGVAPPDDLGERPARLSDDRLCDLIGEHKHRAHLNYLYGVVVEQALQYAVELDLAKERASVNIKDARSPEDAQDPIYERIYSRPRADLLREFREEAAHPNDPHISLAELHEFLYWLFKYRVKNQEPARVASDTRKALAQLSRIEASAGRQRRQPVAAQ